jgi:hypothetical protein
LFDEGAHRAASKRENNESRLISSPDMLRGDHLLTKIGSISKSGLLKSEIFIFLLLAKGQA